MARDPRASAGHGFTPFALTVLFVAAGAAPLGTGSYLPALPDVAADLGVSSAEVQLTLTAFIVGIAGGQLIIGPLSDRIGRRIPLIAGLLVFSIVNFFSAGVDSLEWLIALRAIQGVAAAAGMVLGRAIVADRSRGDETARLLSLMTAVTMLVPAVSPLLGAGILVFGSWRTVFVVLGVLSLALTVLVAIFVPETLDRTRASTPGGAARRARGKPAPGRAGTATDTRVRQRGMGPFIFYTLTVAFSFATMYGYIASGPFVFQTIHGFSQLGYAATTAGISLLMGLVGFRLQSRIGTPSMFGMLTPARMSGLGLLVMAVGALFVAAASVTDAPAWVWIVAFAVVCAPLAIVSGVVTAMAMEASPWKPGMSSAVIGTVQSLIGAAAPPLAGIGGETSTTAMAVLMVSAAGLTVSSFWLARRMSRPSAAA